MNKSPDDIIQAQPAPLSHLSADAAPRRLTDALDGRNVAVAALVLAVAVVAFVWRPEVVPDINVSSDATIPAAINNAPATSESEQLAPFAQTQKDRARQQAQEALSNFVEKQILLEDTLQVTAWGAAELAQAMALAQTGDAEFTAEKFAASVLAYEQADRSLAAIIEQGDTLFNQHLASGLQYILALDSEAAIAVIEEALIIKPDDHQAQALLQRARQLPVIIGMLRTAKNHELGSRYAKALIVYADIEKLDPHTQGLSALKAAAASGQAGDDLTSYISRGFEALDNKQFERAKRAFDQALKLDPGNDIAMGGLQQVATKNDLAIIVNHERQAQRAIVEEDWQRAVDAYKAVLALDNNIQFALNGRVSAQTHLRAQRLLTKISAAPQKLSSEKLYLDALAILAEAKQLEYKGPKMSSAIEQVSQLLQLYRDPVDVVLISDNATNVIMSNVGQLGYFEQKTLTLRPGQYTIRGSQAGCRDIYLSIEVLPGIAPLDLSCPEPIKR